MSALATAHIKLDEELLDQLKVLRGLREALAVLPGAHHDLRRSVIEDDRGGLTRLLDYIDRAHHLDALYRSMAPKGS